MKYFYFLTILLFFSCKKTEKNDNFEKYQFDLCTKCTDTDIPELKGLNSGYEFIIDTSNINYPYFNPNNSNEILYYNQYISNNIYIYDRLSKTKKVLLKSNLLSPPKWGANDWILFDNGSVYGIKSNGDSLKYITKGYNPEWNYTSDKFAVDVINPVTRKSIGAVYNWNSNLIDTLPFILGAGKCWQNKTNKIALYAPEEFMQGYAISDMNTKTRTLLNKIKSPGPPCWINDNEFIYTYDTYLIVFNINTGISRTISKLCSNESIGYLSYSPLSNELITSINHWKSLGGDKILVTTKIMILNFIDNSVTYITP